MNRRAVVLAVIAALSGFSSRPASGVELNVELMMTVGHECRLTVRSTEGGREQSAITRFQADRLDSLGRYIRGVEEGGIDSAGLEGTYSMDGEVIRADDGTFRAATPVDPVESRLRLTKTFSLSPRGHCTFLQAVVRPRGSNEVIRHYAWGYPWGGMRDPGPGDVPGATPKPRGGEL